MQRCWFELLEERVTDFFDHGTPTVAGAGAAGAGGLGSGGKRGGGKRGIGALVSAPGTLSAQKSTALAHVTGRENLRLEKRISFILNVCYALGDVFCFHVWVVFE